MLLGYRPGGPTDLLVGMAAIRPVLIAAAAIVWPPVARGDRAFIRIAWIAIASVLVLVPSVAGLVAQLSARGPQTLLPSLETAYPWLLALAATGLFAGLGVARRHLGGASLRRERLVLGSVIAAVLVLVSGGAFATAAFVNELALRDRPAIASRFGPTDPALEPPACDDPVSAGTTARLALASMARWTAATRAGRLQGIRNGADFRGRATPPPGSPWAAGPDAGRRASVGALARTSWTAADAERGAGYDIDRQVVAVALTPADANAPDDRGLAFIDGARARHCRIPIDGATFRKILPQVALRSVATDISRWRGDLDYWVFADGELGQVDGRVSGTAEGLDEDSLQAGVRFRMLAFDRGLPISVLPPTR